VEGSLPGNEQKKDGKSKNSNNGYRERGGGNWVTTSPEDLHARISLRRTAMGGDG